MRSPGWQLSAVQSASSVEKRMARALLVLRIERLASVMPMRSANSDSVTRRSSITRSRLSLIGIRLARTLDRQIVFALERETLAEDLRQRQNQEACEEHRTVE